MFHPRSGEAARPVLVVYGSVLRGERHRTPLPRNRLSRWRTEDNSRCCSSEVSEQEIFIAATYLDITISFRAPVRRCLSVSGISYAGCTPVSGCGGRWQIKFTRSFRFSSATTVPGASELRQARLLCQVPAPFE